MMAAAMRFLFKNFYPLITLIIETNPVLNPLNPRNLSQRQCPGDRNLFRCVTDKFNFHFY